MDLLDERHVAISKALISEWEAESSSTRDEIARLESAIEGHRATLARLESLIAELKAGIAPIRRLPFEILGEIICYCTLDRSATPSVVRTMALVSRTWRRTVLNTPRAWSKIPLWCGLDSDRNYLPLRDARLWFTRAGACGKHVSVAGNATRSETLCSVLDLIQQYRATLASLDVQFYFPNPGPGLCDKAQTRLLALLSAPMPVLHHLVLRRYCIDDQVRRALVFANKPRLSALYANGVEAAWFPAHRPNQLRHLALFIPTVNSLDVLSRTGALNGLRSLLITAADMRDTRDAGALKANDLELLGLNNFAGPQNFITWLSAPKLTKLVLRGDQRNKRSEATQCFKALASARVPLKELYLLKFACSDSAMLALLVGMPLLETFVAELAQRSDFIFLALSTPNYVHGKKDVGWVCPRLARLSVQCSRPIPPKQISEIKAMEDLVESRLKAFRRGAQHPVPGGSANAGSTVQPVAELVAVRLDALELAGFGPDVPRDRWEWIDYLHFGSQYRPGQYEWWAASTGDVQF